MNDGGCGRKQRTGRLTAPVRAEVRPYETQYRLVVITPPPIRERSIVMSVFVCLSVCVCLSAIISSELYVRSATIFYARVVKWFGPPL